jgi:hypothetical protein
MKAIEGSWIVTKNGVVKYVPSSFRKCRFPCLISESDLIFSLPVDFRRRLARFRRMVSAFVSGKKQNRRSQQNPHMMSSSYRDHLQELNGTENPDSNGPRAGPAKAATPQNARPYGILGNDRRSPAEAPPVARTGPPRTPWIKRRTTSPGKFETRHVTAVMMMKSVKDAKYGIFLPIRGISDSGLKNKGPTP